jgi:hypothetical protein
MRSANASLAAFMTVLASACSMSERETGFSVRDSLGIEIAESRMAGAATPTWTLEAQPALHLDGHEFDRISGIARLSDGRILVAQRSDPHLRIFSPDGALLGSIGRAGRGPGEFQFIASTQRLPGDTMVAVDADARHVSFIDPAGAIAGNAAIPPGIDTHGIQRLSDGRWVATVRPPQQPPGQWREGIRRDSMAVVILDLAQESVDTIGVFPGMEIQIVTLEDGVARGRPFLGRDLVVNVLGNAIHIGSGESFEIAIYDADGALQRVIRVPDADLSIRPEEWEAHQQEQLAGVDEENASLRRYFTHSARPGARAPYSRFLFDTEGRLWTSPFDDDEVQNGAWHVFDPSGRLIARLVPPENFRIMDFGTDLAVGIWRDELDVQHVRAYRITRN